MPRETQVSAGSLDREKVRSAYHGTMAILLCLGALLLFSTYHTLAGERRRTVRPVDNVENPVMERKELEHGTLYGIASSGFGPVEPYVAIKTDSGFRFLSASVFGFDLDYDIHTVPSELVRYAELHGWDFPDSDVLARWSDRAESERVVSRFPDGSVSERSEHPAVLEAEMILQEQTPEGRVNAYLRTQSRWPGSSSSILYDANGFAGAFVTVYTDNPVKLQMLLSWLGVPKSVSGPAVGMER